VLQRRWQLRLLSCTSPGRYGNRFTCPSGFLEPRRASPGVLGRDLWPSETAFVLCAFVDLSGIGMGRVAESERLVKGNCPPKG
jgi:hypothetical protein